MTFMSYDTIFLNAFLGIVYLCAWAVLVAALAVGAAGGTGQAARRRAVAFAGGFSLAYLVLNLYGTSISQYLLSHRFALAMGGAILIVLEGIGLLGVPMLWARLRHRPAEDKSDIDTTGALVLGAASAVAGGLCGNAQAINAAQALGYSGHPIAAAGVMSLAAIGSFLGIIVLLYLWDVVIARLGIGRWRLRVAGAGLVLLAGAIALGWVA